MKPFWSPAYEGLKDLCDAMIPDLKSFLTELSRTFLFDKLTHDILKPI